MKEKNRKIIIKIMILVRYNRAGGVSDLIPADGNNYPGAGNKHWELGVRKLQGNGEHNSKSRQSKLQQYILGAL